MDGRSVAIATIAEVNSIISDDQNGEGSGEDVGVDKRKKKGYRERGKIISASRAPYSTRIPR